MVLNSVDNFLDEENDGDAFNDGNEGNELSKNVISTEGCFACDMNKNAPKGQAVQLSRQTTTSSQSRRRHSQTTQGGRRRRHHHGSRARRHLEKPALIGMSRVFGATPFFINDTSRVVADNFVRHDPSKLTVKLTRDRTKMKRPILFLQPALTDDLETSHHVYALRGKDRNLFGLRRAPDGVWALFYQVIKPYFDV
jgi:hypothetical protein